MKVYLPAEWEPQETVIMAWPDTHTDWIECLDAAQACVAEIASAIAEVARVVMVTLDPEETAQLISHPNVTLVSEIPYNDTWARDFGPISLIDDDGNVLALDFVFNGWGLKFPANFDNLLTSRLFAKGALKPITRLMTSNFVLEGGSIESDGEGTILTTSFCLMAPNRNYIVKENIDKCLKNMLGADRVLWLGSGKLIGDDTDGHIDTIARFIAPDAIAYAACDRDSDPQAEELAKLEQELEQLRTKDGEPYLLVPLPIPNPIYDADGQRLPATYANFLICNGRVLLPTYGDAHYDKLAIDTLTLAMPQYEVVPINCRVLIEQHGSLHCMTMQIPQSTED